jgi:hypothetical protein
MERSVNIKRTTFKLPDGVVSEPLDLLPLSR